MSGGTASQNAGASEQIAPPRDDAFYPRLYLVAAAAVLVAAAVLEIDQRARVILPGLGVALPETCWFFRWTGVGCPGCGLTRCFICLMHGQYAEAWRYNPGGYVFFLLVAVQIPFQAWQLWRLRCGRGPLRPQRLTLAVLIAAMTVLLLQWGMRLLFPH